MGVKEGGGELSTFTSFSFSTFPVKIECQSGEVSKVEFTISTGPELPVGTHLSVHVWRFRASKASKDCMMWLRA